jgi:hypothetical protein
MFKSLGNILVNPSVGMLFISMPEFSWDEPALSLAVKDTKGRIWRGPTAHQLERLRAGPDRAGALNSSHRAAQANGATLGSSSTRSASTTSATSP